VDIRIGRAWHNVELPDVLKMPLSTEPEVGLWVEFVPW